MQEELKEINENLKRINETLALSKKVLTLDEAVQYLGYAKSYVYKLTHLGILPFSKPNNKSIFFDREKLEAWMLKNPNMSLEEIEYVTTTHPIDH